MRRNAAPVFYLINVLLLPITLIGYARIFLSAGKCAWGGFAVAAVPARG